MRFAVTMGLKMVPSRDKYYAKIGETPESAHAALERFEQSTTSLVASILTMLPPPP